MKTEFDEFLSRAASGFDDEENTQEYHRNDIVLEALRLAWNAAVDKCAETAEIGSKVASGEGGSLKTFFVNEQSILKNKLP